MTGSQATEGEEEEVEEDEETRGWEAAEGECLVFAVDAVVVAVASDARWVIWGETDKLDGDATDPTDVEDFMLVSVIMSLPLLLLMLDRL